MNYPVAYFIENQVLMGKWSPPSPTDGRLDVFQVVVPCSLRNKVLNLAHDHPCSGHAGVCKTYLRALKYFVWPGIKGDVVCYCWICHTYQVVRKPNHFIPPAPLQTISIQTEPFERIIVDCVGPLPKTPSGNCYLLTLMCAVTHFPDAIPVCTLKSRTIKAKHSYIYI